MAVYAYFIDPVATNDNYFYKSEQFEQIIKFEVDTRQSVVRLQ